MILFAFVLTILVSISAIVIDGGYVAAEHQKLQNVADAAALAAAQELPDTVKAESTAKEYARLNGVDESNIAVSFSDADKVVKVVGNKNIQLLFARVMGFDNKMTTVSSSAEMASVGDAFNYTVFSGSKTVTLTMNGSSQTIDGSTHTNYSFVANGSKLTITGECEAVNIITVNGSQINIDDRVPHAEYIEMPDFSETIRLQAEKAGQAFVGNKTFNGSEIEVDEPIYVQGNVTVNGSQFKGKGCILATGSITFNGSNLNQTSEDAVCFYSQNGDITINGSNAKLDGILYAPKGSVTMNGSNQTVNGRIIANTVTFNGSNLNIIGGTNELKSLPTYGVKLIN